MPNEIGLGREELLERGADLVKIDIGEEAIDTCVNAGRLGPA
jgi:hypothetical protein